MTDIKEKLKELDSHIKLSQYGSQIDFNYLYKLFNELLYDYIIIKKDTLKYRLEIKESTENWTLLPSMAKTVLTCELPLKVSSSVYDKYLEIGPDVRKKILDEMKEELLEKFCNYLENKCD